VLFVGPKRVSGGSEQTYLVVFAGHLFRRSVDCDALRLDWRPNSTFAEADGVRGNAAASEHEEWEAPANAFDHSKRDYSFLAQTEHFPPPFAQ
jgi:hypothetical protein